MPEGEDGGEDGEGGDGGVPVVQPELVESQEGAGPADPGAAVDQHGARLPALLLLLLHLLRPEHQVHQAPVVLRHSQVRPDLRVHLQVEEEEKEEE